MHLENLVTDAVEPNLLGRFWEAALGGEQLTDEPAGYETRLWTEGWPFFDLGFQRVSEPRSAPSRLHLDLHGGADQSATVERLLGLGARHLDIGQGDVPWVVLADLEGNPFCVMEEREAYVDTGPIAALPLDSADPERDAAFWARLGGWVDVPGAGLRSLRHPSLRGPLLEFCPERMPKGTTKNRLHLDFRLDPGEDYDEVEAGIVERGGRTLQTDWGELPWRSYLDPSGNEFCVLPAPSEQQEPSSH